MDSALSHSPQGQKLNLQTRSHKASSGGNQGDLFLVVREGSLADVESALAQLKKAGGNINLRNAFGLTPLHVSVWRNRIPIVRRLLAAGADPDARDGESGWTSLHRALHFGHLAVASVLLQSGASGTIEDFKSRAPIDLLSGPVSQVVGTEQISVTTEIFSWGSGTNYQLGTGNAHIQKLPCKVESLHGSFIKFISAAKFHSVAVSSRGELYTWGFGRGGRLGHPEFDIHSGQAAVITPRQVVSGLGHRRVKAVAAAKHHTVIATESGEVFTWGSNREGQLGYTSVDTQPTPRRVSSLKSKIVAVAAANKHTAVVSETGEVFTWGCNKEGQLGYGTCNSGSNYTPRLVEYLKGKTFKRVAAAKYHTIVLGRDGEVYTWGHRLVTPRRVNFARNLKKSGSILMKFHRMERLHVVSIAAGMVHSMALTDDGALFYWASSDSDLKCQQLYALCGKPMVSISAGKYWTASVSSTGDVYLWDAKKCKDKLPLLTRLHGVKRAASVSVGETHLLIVSSIYHPVYHVGVTKDPPKLKSKFENELGDLDEGLVFDEMKIAHELPSAEKGFANKSVRVPCLKSLCEKAAADFLVEPRNALQLLEIADSLGADDLRRHCEEIVIRNLDYIFTVSSHAIASASLEILVHLEKLLDKRSTEPWSYRRLPTSTATFPAVIDSEEDSVGEFPRKRDNHAVMGTKKGDNRRTGSFLQHLDETNQEMSKQVRAVRKKLQQIEVLQAKQAKGHVLDDQQIAKLNSKSALENSLVELGFPIEMTSNSSSVGQVDAKGNRKVEMSKKQRRKNKQKSSHMEIDKSSADSSIVKDREDVGFSLPVEKKEFAVLKDSTLGYQQRDSSDDLNLTNSSPLAIASKKKNRKGGLSMFLSGALDVPLPQKEVAPPPPSPKIEGPVWGGSKVSKPSASLRVIQDEQRKTKGNVAVGRNRDNIEELAEEKGSVKVPLGSFIISKPISVVPASKSESCDGDKGTPPWAASGTPPLLSRPSLRDIQMQQGKNHLPVSYSPKTKTTGFSVANVNQGSPSDSGGVNRWFRPEVDSTSSIRSIQIEEKAMKDLRRYYSNVKIIKNQS